MIFGILSSQSCILSEIGRKLGETTTLKKIIDRLSRNLKEFNNAEILFENYLHSVKSQINNTILIIEHSKRIYGVNKFTFYVIAYGLFVVFSKCKQGIADMLKKKPKSMQLLMFPYPGFNWC